MTVLHKPFVSFRITRNTKIFTDISLQAKGESLVPNNFSSVTNDFFFDGQRFKFTLNKAQSPESGFSDMTGYF